MIKLFASYSRKDEAAVRDLIADLGRAHLSVWHDQALHGGDPWWQNILRRIRECDVFLFALSKDSLASKPCLAELAYARALGLPVLPVQIGPVGNLRTTPVADIQVMDYRERTLASGMTLIEAIQDAATGRRPLPDPLPEPPPVPFEYLLRLGSAIGAAQLTPDQQGDFIRQLRECLETEEDEGVKEDARELLLALRRRPDITYRNVSAVDELLAELAAPEAQEADAEGVRRSQSGPRRRLVSRLGADLQASGSEPKVIDSGTARRRVGRRTVGLLVLLLTVLTVAAVVLVIRPEDPQPTSGSTPTATHTLEPTSGPTSEPASLEGVFAGRASNAAIGLSIVVESGKATAYVCDGNTLEVWLQGAIDGDRVELTSKAGASLSGTVNGQSMSGQILTPSAQISFLASAAEPPAGVYRAEIEVNGHMTRIGWAVLPDGTQLGVSQTGEDGVPAPALDTSTRTFSLNGRTYQAALVPAGGLR
jgi:hypothetical protein